MSRSNNPLRIPNSAIYLSLLFYALIGFVIIWLWQGNATASYMREMLTLDHPASVWMAVIAAAAGQLYLLATKRVFGFHLPATEGVQVLQSIIRKHSVVNIPSISLVSAVCEEILFRAALLGLLASWLGDAAGCLIVTVIFGLVHIPQYRGSWNAIGYVFVFGLLMNLLFVWYGNLWGPIVLHFLNNLLNFTWMRLGYIQIRERPS